MLTNHSSCSISVVTVCICIFEDVCVSYGVAHDEATQNCAGSETTLKPLYTELKLRSSGRSENAIMNLVVPMIRISFWKEVINNVPLLTVHVYPTCITSNSWSLIMITSGDVFLAVFWTWIANSMHFVCFHILSYDGVPYIKFYSIFFTYKDILLRRALLLFVVVVTHPYPYTCIQCKQMFIPDHPGLSLVNVMCTARLTETIYICTFRQDSLDVSKNKWTDWSVKCNTTTTCLSFIMWNQSEKYVYFNLLIDSWHSTPYIVCQCCHLIALTPVDSHVTVSCH